MINRSGFDITKHPLSLLSLGDAGWIQVANFVATGVLAIACAVGLRQALHLTPGETSGPLLIAACSPLSVVRTFGAKWGAD